MQIDSTHLPSRFNSECNACFDILLPIVNRSVQCAISVCILLSETILKSCCTICFLHEAQYMVGITIVTRCFESPILPIILQAFFRFSVVAKVFFPRIYVLSCRSFAFFRDGSRIVSSHRPVYSSDVSYAGGSENQSNHASC